MISKLPPHIVRQFPYGKISDFTLLGTALALLALLLFPPFYLPLPGGYATNLGFGWLFSPPLRGQAVGLVDISLLLLELVVVATAGGLVFVWARGGGDLFFDEISVVGRKMSANERKNIIAVLAFHERTGRPLDIERLKQHDASDAQLDYVRAYLSLKEATARTSA